MSHFTTFIAVLLGSSWNGSCPGQGKQQEENQEQEETQNQEQEETQEEEGKSNVRTASQFQSNKALTCYLFIDCSQKMMYLSFAWGEKR